jgi:photosystem II stability/assembly factor-like uncharacterized protein
MKKCYVLALKAFSSVLSFIQNNKPHVVYEKTIMVENTSARSENTNPLGGVMKRFLLLSEFVLCLLIIYSNSLLAQWVQTYNIRKVRTFAVIGSNLFAGSFGSGIYLSTNQGVNWKSVNAGLTNKFVWKLFADGTTLYAGTENFIYRSTNNGTSWISLNSGTSFGRVTVIAMHDNIFFAGGQGGVCRSTDNGDHWTMTTLGLEGSVWALAWLDTTLVAGTDRGVFASSDMGSNWIPLNHNIRFIWGDFALIDHHLFAPAIDGIYRSTDGGANWTSINSDLKIQRQKERVFATDNNLFASVDTGIYLSTNEGTTWERVNHGLPSMPGVEALAVQDTFFFVGTEGNGNGVWRRPQSEMVSSSPPPYSYGRIAFQRSTANSEFKDGKIFLLTLPDGPLMDIQEDYKVHPLLSTALNPHFSPDGSRLVFMGTEIGEKKGIYIWDIGSDTLLFISDRRWVDEDPKFSNDGTKIVFKRDGRIFSMNIDGGDAERIIDPNVQDVEQSMPYFTTDDKAVIYSVGAHRNSSIWMVKLDDRDHPIPLINSELQDYYPIVSDANHALYVTGIVRPIINDTIDQIAICDFSNPFNTSKDFLNINLDFAENADPYPMGGEYLLFSRSLFLFTKDYDLWFGDTLHRKIWQVPNTGVNTDNRELGGTYTISAVTASAPEVPSSLTAKAMGSDQIVLTWDDMSSNEIGFVIERKTNAVGVYSILSKRPVNSTTFLDHNLSPGTEYYYRIRAYNCMNLSDNFEWSNEANATTWQFDKHRIYCWLPDWRPGYDDAVAYLKGHGSLFYQVMAQWFRPMISGELLSTEAYKDPERKNLEVFCERNGIQLIPSLFVANTADRDITCFLLNNGEEIMKIHISNIVTRISNYIGLNLDYKNIDMCPFLEGNSLAFNRFVELLADSLHIRGKFLSLTLQTNYKLLDYKKLFSFADEIKVGFYDMNVESQQPSTCLSGLRVLSHSPIYVSYQSDNNCNVQSIDKIVRYIDFTVPPQYRSKLVMALPTYGYLFSDGTSSGQVTYGDAMALQNQFNAEIKRDQDIGGIPYFEFQDGGMSKSVWYEDKTSLAAKLDYALQNSVDKIALWRIGSSDPDIESPLKAYQSNIFSDPSTMVINSGCPVNLRIIDPDGLITSKTITQDSSICYTENLEDTLGNKEDKIIVWKPKRGMYQIFVEPDSTATPSDTYSLSIRQGNDTTVLASNVQVQNIPDSPYVFQNITSNYLYGNSWNLVSVPVKVSDYSTKGLFPSAISEAFSYGGVYNPEDSLKNGHGYWIKFSQLNINYLSGLSISAETVSVREGWNLVGSISVPIPTSSIASDPHGITTTNIFGYNGRYFATDSIRPGFGYWIKVSQDGKLILDANASASTIAKNRIKIISTNEMPPPPPEDISSQDNLVPQMYALEQAYPNPFNPTTTIKYSLPQYSRVTLKVYNVLGQMIATLSDEVQSAGYKSATWTATGVASGIYFYRLEATSVSDVGESFTQVKKMLLIK